MSFNKEELKEILEQHKLWLENNGGKHADLRGANLRDANLRGANLRDANLRGANLRGSNLQDADLQHTNLQHVDLWSADLRGANLRDADLRGANLDFSSMPLWCGDLKANYDDKQIIQQLYHVLSHVKNSVNCSERLKYILLNDETIALANEFHRVKECGEIIKESETE